MQLSRDRPVMEDAAITVIVVGTSIGLNVVVFVAVMKVGMFQHIIVLKEIVWLNSVYPVLSVHLVHTIVLARGVETMVGNA